MARGWESKSVEAQMELAADLKSADEKRGVDRARKSKRESLVMSRARVLQEISSCHNPRYKDLLVKSLEHLDEQLRELD